MAAERLPSILSSVPALCLDAALKHQKGDALNQRSREGWTSLDSNSFVTRVKQLALGLAELGIRSGDRIGLISENRPEWSISDMAILSLGAVNVPIYTTQAVDQLRYILANSGVRLLFVSNQRIFKHARQALAGLDSVERIIFFEPELPEGLESSITLGSVEILGQKRLRENPGAFDELLNLITPQTLATIIYTSGTTGEPKGVMLSHNNFIANVLAISKGLPIGPDDVAVSVLPLSHIFERIAFYVFCYHGVSVYYVASFDQVGDALREVRPTVMTAVPRLFEKVYHRIVKKGLSEKGLKRKIFTRSLAVGQRYAELRDKRRPVPAILNVEQKIADKLVFAKWRAGIGGRVKYFVSGGAPLSPTLSYSFLAAGIMVLQGYGATETCIVTANRPENNRVGSVGLPLPGIEVAIAADGEILVTGPNITQGYFGQPDATAAVMKNGWFATGDVGHLDEDGRLYITDRKKDLFKLSNGKYVAPQQIESLLKESEFVSQVVVVGSGRKQPGALIVPDWESLRHALASSGQDFPQDRHELSSHPAAVKLVQGDVITLTGRLPEHERVRRIALLPDEFTIDGGELTPTLKIKRPVIDERFANLIDRLYA